MRFHIVDTPADSIGGAAVQLRTFEEFDMSIHAHPIARAYFPYSSLVVERREEIRDGVEILLSETTRNATVDDYGNLKTIITTDSTGETEGVSATYRHELDSTFINSWLVGLPATTTRTHTAGGGTKTQTWELEHEVKGGLYKIIREPNDPALRNETSFIRDPYGNVRVTQVVGGSTLRTNTVEYEGRGIFPRLHTDEDGYKTEFTFDHAVGRPTLVVERGKPGSTVAIQSAVLYDGFGRIRYSRAPNGVVTRTDHISLFDPYHPYRVHVRTDGGKRKLSTSTI